jgi:predicted MFS family arabinose efflux permease
LVLAVLLIAYIFNYLDREIPGILATPIKADLQLSDTQFGAIGGLAFALLYAVMGLPLAYLADRTSRSNVIAASLLLWSGFTALCGTAHGYWQLFLYRLGVGVGEAGGVAPSYALIADYFPPGQRARALAIFFLGIPIGISAGTLGGAYIAHALNWRAAFIATGLAGILLAPLMRMLVRDLPRSTPAPSRAPVSSVFPMLARKPSFWLLAFAASSSSLCGYGLGLWTPSVLMRSFGLDLLSTANFRASYIIIGGCSGIIAGGWFADRLGTMDRGWYVKLPAIAWVITMPVLSAGYLAPNAWVAWPLLLVGNMLNVIYLGPIVAAVQHLVPQPMRATASASFLLINNLIGLGVGPWLMGRLSDALKASQGIHSLRDAAVGCTGFYLLAALLALIAIKSLKKGWIEDSQPPST